MRRRQAVVAPQQPATYTACEQRFLLPCFMFRRFVSLLVIAGYAISHLAVVPHAHGSASDGDQQRLHSAPHFHLAWFSGGHSHAGDTATHDHSHEHSHASPAEAAALADDAKKRGHIGSPPDADAVFVPQATIAADQRELQSAGNVALSDIYGLHPAVAEVTGRDGVQFWRWRPPDRVDDGSQLYLTLRTLRI